MTNMNTDVDANTDILAPDNAGAFGVCQAPVNTLANPDAASDEAFLPPLAGEGAPLEVPQKPKNMYIACWYYTSEISIHYSSTGKSLSQCPYTSITISAEIFLVPEPCPVFPLYSQYNTNDPQKHLQK